MGVLYVLREAFKNMQSDYKPTAQDKLYAAGLFIVFIIICITAGTLNMPV